MTTQFRPNITRVKGLSEKRRMPLHRAYMAAAKTGLDVGEEDYRK